MPGIVAYGTYVPYCRLQRAAIGAALGAGGGKGTRAVASYDEDTTTMGVEAARVALRAAPGGVSPQAGAVRHRRRRRTSTRPTPPPSTPRSASPAIGARVRHGRLGALARSARMRLRRRVAGADRWSCSSDIRTGLPGGADERDGGDAAAAFLVRPTGDRGRSPSCSAAASATDEFLDRWRTPGDARLTSVGGAVRRDAYVPLAEDGRHRRAEAGRHHRRRGRPR